MHWVFNIFFLLQGDAKTPFDEDKFIANAFNDSTIGAFLVKEGESEHDQPADDSTKQ